MTAPLFTRLAGKPVILALASAAAGQFVIATLAFHAARGTGALPGPHRASPDMLGGLLLLVAITTGFVFLHWLARSYRRLIEEGFPMGYTPSMAVLAWFVPFVNWVWPFRIMRELLEAVVDSRAIAESTETTLLVRLRWWWGIVLFAGVGLPLLDGLRIVLARSAGDILRLRLEFLGFAALSGAVATGLLLSVVVVIQSALARPPRATPVPDALHLYRKRAASRS